MAKEPIQEDAIDKSKEYQPTVLVFDTPEEVDAYAAQQIISQLKVKPNSVLTLPTGNTPLGMYQKLVASFEEKKVDFSDAIFFNLDEYWPIRRDNPASFYHYMQHQLFRFVRVTKERLFIPDGEAKDPREESMRYERLLQQYGPADIAILGIGPGTTAHIGFNEQGSALDSRTRYVRLDDQTKKANATSFSSLSDMPEGSVTQGIADILASKRIFLLAKGEGKSWGIHRMLYGQISSDAPASFLRLHPRVTIVLDKAAAALLPVK